MSRKPDKEATRTALLKAARELMLEKGYTAATVDLICARAGVTKGAFFHHFATKEQLGVAAAHHWSTSTAAFFASAPFHHETDSAARVLGYVDLRIALIAGPPESFSCVAGTMVQESFATSPAIRDACAASIGANARALEADLGDALATRGIIKPDAQSLARYVQTVIQGAFVTAKALAPEDAAPAARESLGHLRRYLELLFAKEPHRG